MRSSTCDAWSEYDMVNDTKAVMTDTQKSPGKTLLWTQQQHYTWVLL